MQLKAYDWVRTRGDKICRIASVNADGMAASVEALDDTGKCVIVLTFPLEQLVRFDAAKYLPERHN